MDLKDHITGYVRKNSAMALFFFVLSICIFGVYLSHDIVTFDAEGFYTAGYEAKWYGQWLELGRWGLVILKKLTGLTFINPYFSAAIFFLCIPLGVLLWTTLLSYWMPSVPSYAAWIFGAVFLSHPVWALQFAYRNQMECISFLLMIMPMALLLYSDWLKNKNNISLIISFILMIFLFGSYQAFEFAGACGLLIILFLYLHQDEEKLVTAKEFAITIGYLAGAFVISMIIAKFFQMRYDIHGGSYLSEQFLWGKQSISQNIAAILSYLKAGFLGNHVEYGPLYLILTILACISVFLHEKNRVLRLIVLAGIVLMPFVLTMVTASEIVSRSQFSYVLSIAFLAWYCCASLVKIKYIPLLLCAVFAVQQAEISTRLLYTHVRVMEEDKERFRMIWQEALEKGAEEGDALCLIGGMSNTVDDTMLEREVIGYSYFEHTEFYGPNKTVEAMSAYGYHVSKPSKEQLAEAERIACEMNLWPHGEDGIRVQDHMIIVRLK